MGVTVVVETVQSFYRSFIGLSSYSNNQYMDGDGKSLEQNLVGDEPSARGQTVLFYFTTRSATYYNIRVGEEGSEDFEYSL